MKAKHYILKFVIKPEEEGPSYSVTMPLSSVLGTWDVKEFLSIYLKNALFDLASEIKENEEKT